MSKVLGIDYGQKRIGLALSDDDQKFAFVYNTIETKDKKQLTKNKILNDIQNICKLEDVKQIVIGMPTNLMGQSNKITEEVFEFIKQLEENLHIPVETQDERLTTVQAQKIKDKSSRNLDELSAQIILQNYLDKINI